MEREPRIIARSAEEDLGFLAISEVDKALVQRQEMFDRWIETGASGVTADDMVE